MIKCNLKLYIAGQTPKSKRAIANLQEICRTELDDNYKLDIIDVLERPQLAEDEKIMATPTLIKVLPIPVRRIIGDLSDIHQVLIGLGLYNCDTKKDASE